MIDSAAGAPAWPWPVDAGRRPRDRHSGRPTGRSSGWRSCAAGRTQAGAGVAESVIYMNQGAISAVTSALAAGTCATAASAGAGSGAAVATGGSDCTSTGLGVTVGVAVAAGAAAAVA